jgi:nucleoside-diphosphate-sugar epimerase
VKRAFVTGGSGFVGRELIRELVARGVETVAMARSDAAVETVMQLGATPARAELTEAPDIDAIHGAMQGCDVVFHAAALVKDHGKLHEFLVVNVGGTKTLLGCARHAGVSRFVHIGTEAVLADGHPIVRADETRPYPKHLAGPYPISKAAAERAVVKANAEGFATVVVRPRFIWGKGDTSVLPKLVDAVKRKRFAWIDGGHYLTSTCHVANVVEGALLAAERGTPGAIYFLTDGEPVELRGFITKLLATRGLDPGTREVPRWAARSVAALTRWMANPPVTRAALALVGTEVTVVDAKARRELGYRSHQTIEAGLDEMRAEMPG